MVKWAQIGWALEPADPGPEEFNGKETGQTVGSASAKASGLEGGPLSGWPIGRSYIVQGCVAVGIIGFSTLVILLPMRGFGFIGYHPNLFRGTMRGDSPANVVLFIIVVAGMARALFLCHKLTSWLSLIVAERSGTVILPAEEGQQSDSGSRKSRIPRWLRARM